MAKKPRRGRPPLKPDDRRTYKLSVTIREKLRRLLEASAADEGRTLSKEVEFRIELSFRREFTFLELAESAMRTVDDVDKRFEEMSARLDHTRRFLERIRKEGFVPNAQIDAETFPLLDVPKPEGEK